MLFLLSVKLFTVVVFVVSVITMFTCDFVVTDIVIQW